MRLQKMHIFGIVAGMAIIIASLFFRKFLSFFIVISLIVLFLPFLASLLKTQRIQREKEEMFLAFSRDLVENVKSGTPIGKSIINLRKRNYGALSSHVEKLANQIEIGIPLSSALGIFARDTNSKIISRSVGLISEAERAGGKIETILESVASSVNQIEVLRKERSAAVANLVTQGYIIFVVFIVIMLVLEYNILPLVEDLSASTGPTTSLGISLGGQPGQMGDFSTPLFVLLIVQSFFSGLVIGKISEGDIKRGFKHSFILLALTLLITTGTRAIFG